MEVTIQKFQIMSYETTASYIKMNSKFNLIVFRTQKETNTFLEWVKIGRFGLDA